MIMAMGMVIAFLVANLVCMVLFFIVLVKLFKNEGALKGILGFFCGIYTFIWGWMKHKQLGMTKIMAIWSVLTVGTMVMVPVMGVSTAYMIPAYIQKMSGGGDFKLGSLESTKNTPNITLPKKHKKAVDKAGTDNRKAVDQQDNSNADWSQKALALWQGDRYKDPNKAVNYWTQAINSKQNTAIAYSNRGLAYYDLKQYQKAVHDYSRAIELDPNYAAAYNNRGNSYYALNAYQQALQDFDQSLKLEPKYAKAYLNRGLVYYQLDKTGQACNDFQKSCDNGDCDGLKWAMKNGICK
jgi:Flp pilus assembly protein TadD